MNILCLLQDAINNNASDIHLIPEVLPAFRIHGSIQPIGDEVFSVADCNALLDFFLDAEQKKLFLLQKEFDFSFAHPSIAHRLRVNVFMQSGAAAFAIRIIPVSIPTLEALQLPPIVRHLARKEHGLILVTGPTGSGKTTTLAAMINHIIHERPSYVLTLEDPIEYVFASQRSIISQREIGTDTSSFASGLRGALREDPDVILVGEIRDLDSLSTAISASETGHLVLATLHTANTIEAIYRLIYSFDEVKQQQIQMQLASSLQGIIAQKLMPRKDQLGRVAAMEVLVATSAVRNLIRKGEPHLLMSALQSGRHDGMQTMQDSIEALRRKNMI